MINTGKHEHIEGLNISSWVANMRYEEAMEMCIKRYVVGMQNSDS